MRSGERNLKVVNMRSCSDVQDYEIFGIITENLSDTTSVFINNIDYWSDVVMYAAIGYAARHGYFVSVVAGENWIFVEKLGKSDGKGDNMMCYIKDHEKSEERKKSILEFYGL